MLVCRVFSYSFNNLNTHQHTHILYSQIAALIASFTFIMFFLFFLLAAISHSLGLPTLTSRRDSPFTIDQALYAGSSRSCLWSSAVIFPPMHVAHFIT